MSNFIPIDTWVAPSRLVKAQDQTKYHNMQMHYLTLRSIVLFFPLCPSPKSGNTCCVTKSQNIYTNLHTNPLLYWSFTHRYLIWTEGMSVGA